MSLLLKNALIKDSKSPLNGKRCDLLIEGGIIKATSAAKAKRVVDLGGKIVTPGWFDLSAHFCDPGEEHKESIASGSKMAFESGFTDVNLIPSTLPPIESKSDVDYILNSPTEVDLHVTAAVSQGLNGENLTEIYDLFRSGAKSFSNGDLSISNAELLLKSLQYTSTLGTPVFQNARDSHLSKNTHMHEGKVSTYLGLRGEPSLSEEITISRDLELLKYAGGAIHFCKISSEKSVALIREAKKKGLSVTCDVAIHHLLFTDQSIGDFDSNYKSLPPFRTDRDRKALIKGLKDGTIDAISSNHRPQDQESKQLEFDLADPGSISIQTFYSSLLLVSKEISMDVLIDKLTHGPRSILGLPEISVADGMPAKLTVLDDEKKWVLNDETNMSKSRNSPFWNKELIGKVFGTINQEFLHLQ